MRTRDGTVVQNSSDMIPGIDSITDIMFRKKSESGDSREDYRRMKERNIMIVSALIVMSFIISLISLGYGPYQMSVREVLISLFRPSGDVGSVVIWDIRINRILAAILVGSSLAIAGTVMQCILRNPLASPYTLGISSAAATGAALSIAVSYVSIFRGTFIQDIMTSIYGTSIMAFLFSMIAVVVVLFFARNNISPEAMVLAGVAIGSIFGALLSSLQYIVDDETLASIVFWTFGDLTKASWTELGILAAVTVPISAYFYYHRMDYNAVEAGTEVARSLGVNTRNLMIKTMVLSSIVAAICVAMCGVIGFVGLLGPHVIRRLIGGDHRYLLVASMVMGSFILLFADALGRIPFESPMPVGIITSFFGGPLFLFMLMRKNRRRSI